MAPRVLHLGNNVLVCPTPPVVLPGACAFRRVSAPEGVQIDASGLGFARSFAGPVFEQVLQFFSRIFMNVLCFTVQSGLRMCKNAMFSKDLLGF